MSHSSVVYCQIVRWSVAILLAVTAAAKALDPSFFRMGWNSTFGSYASMELVMAIVLFELLLAGWLILSSSRRTPGGSRAALGASALVFCAFTGYHLLNLIQGTNRTCGCMGGLWLSFFEKPPHVFVETLFAFVPALLLLNALIVSRVDPTIDEAEHSSPRSKGVKLGLAGVVAAAAFSLAHLVPSMLVPRTDGYRSLLGEFRPVPEVLRAASEPSVGALVRAHVAKGLMDLSPPASHVDSLLDDIDRLVNAQAAASLDDYIAASTRRGDELNPLWVEECRKAWKAGRWIAPEGWRTMSQGEVLRYRVQKVETWSQIGVERLVVFRPNRSGPKPAPNLERPPAGERFPTTPGMVVGWGAPLYGPAAGQDAPGLDEVYIDLPIVKQGTRVLYRYVYGLDSENQWNLRSWVSLTDSSVFPDPMFVQNLF